MGQRHSAMAMAPNYQVINPNRTEPSPNIDGAWTDVNRGGFWIQQSPGTKDVTISMNKGNGWSIRKAYVTKWGSRWELRWTDDDYWDHKDLSTATILSDAYGNAYRLEWNTIHNDWVRV